MAEITIDRDKLVELLQTFYYQGFDDASHTPAPFDMKGAAEHQIDILIATGVDMEQAEKDLLEWERKQGLV
jgi:hypothetical protein